MTPATCGRGDEEVDHPDAGGASSVVTAISVSHSMRVKTLFVGSSRRRRKLAVESKAYRTDDCA
jgi:hypothetical protein